MEDELAAMKSINQILTDLNDSEAVGRVLSWAASKHGVNLGTPKSAMNAHNQVGGSSEAATETSTASIADIFDAANPTTEPEKVLVVAYWLQELQHQGEFDSQTINGELKNLGHGVGNITRALANLIDRRPRLVIQTKKSGTSQQARKRYKVTVEGIKFVKAMLGNGQEDE